MIIKHFRYSDMSEKVLMKDRLASKLREERFKLWIETPLLRTILHKPINTKLIIW